MAFRLALALGVSHPDRLLADLSAREFDEWVAYFQIEPWGTFAADVRTAMLAQIITAVHTDTKKNKVPELREFLPSWQRGLLRAAEEAEADIDDPGAEDWHRWRRTFEILAMLNKRGE